MHALYYLHATKQGMGDLSVVLPSSDERTLEEPTEVFFGTKRMAKNA